MYDIENLLKKKILLERRRVFIGFQANSLVLKSRLWHINRRTDKQERQMHQRLSDL